MKEIFKDYLEKDAKFDVLTWLGIFGIIIVFSGMFGWLYEFVFYYFNSGCKIFFMRGGNFLPFINIYAWGSVIIFSLTYKFRKNPLKIFIISALTTGILELISGYLMYKLTGMRCWDYTREILGYFNIGGYVCLRSVIVFGLSALLLMYVVVPIVFFIAENSNKKIFIIITLTIFTIFLCDELYNLVIANIFNLPRASKIYKSLGVPYMNYFY